ncbi:MAG TPA: DMT family transporter [Acidimicrobiales bacterium]|nr:DMT family transporter [Acidimicrobiales bacterium]
MSRRGWSLFLMMAVIWGIPYLLIRVAVRQLDPGVMVLLRTAPASLLLAPIVIARRQIPVLLANARWIIVFAVVEFGIPWYCMSTAERHISSSLTSLLICCVPLFAVLVARVRRTDEHISRRRYLGLGIGAVGVAFLVGLDLRGGSITWIGLMMIVCLGYCFGPMILATKLAHVPGVVVVAGATAFVALCWAPWALAHWPTHVSGETWSCMAVLSVVCTATAFLVFFELVKEVGSSRSVVVTYFNTAIAVVLGIVGLHEALTAGILLGFPLVLVGCILATSRSKVPASSELLGVLSGDADLAVDQHPE